MIYTQSFQINFKNMRLGDTECVARKNHTSMTSTVHNNSSSSVTYFCSVKINGTQQYRISNTNGHRKGKKQQNDQRSNMLARMKLEDKGISRHGRNTRLN